VHPVLKRQLKHLGLDEGVPPADSAGWQALLARVDATYAQGDQDRYTLERSLDVSSTEMHQLYDELGRASETALAAERDKLQTSVATLRATIEASVGGIAVIDEHRQLVGYNQRCLELWGISEAEVTAFTIEDLRTLVMNRAVDPDAFRRLAEALYRDRTAVSHDEIVLRDGRIIECCSRAVQLPSGSDQGRVWFFRDITADRRAEEELVRVNRFLDSIIGNIPDMIFVKDADTLQFVELNPAGEALLGVRRADLLGKSDADFFPADQVEFFVAKDREVLASRAMLDIPEEPIETPHGRRVLHTKKIPIYDDHGRARYLLGISRDITAAKHAEQQLREAVELAETASRAKSGFLSNMSHEMRTPLNSILGFARVLEGGKFGALTERQREYLDYVLRAGRHMLNLVNDLLDLRRIEEDRAAIAVTRIPVDAVVGEALEMVKPLVDEKCHAISVSLDPALPEALADRRAVVQILVNLLSNAAKFTPASGRIEVTARAVEHSITVGVHDSGIGIRPEDQPKLFTYFEQLGAKHDHHMQGSGIGLALTRALVERLGGRIHVRSAPGAGSTFEFSIPRWTEAP
jgi:PAS domain S-box-containing protein